MTEPDDRALEEYLKGNSPVSRRYRDASHESTPPALDDAVLARARAEARRRRRARPWLASVALAASLVLGINLAWNIWQAEEQPRFVHEPAAPEHPTVVPDPPSAQALAPAADAVAPGRSAERQPAHENADPGSAGAPPPDHAADAERRADARQSRRSTERAATATAAPPRASASSAEAAPSSAGQGASAGRAEAPMAAPSLTEPERIEHLIRFVATLQDVVFIRNGQEHSAADAASHMRLKRERAGDRVRTADDFIRLCAARSSTTGEAYRMRFADGRMRTAEDVLREELARLR